MFMKTPLQKNLILIATIPLKTVIVINHTSQSQKAMMRMTILVKIAMIILTIRNITLQMLTLANMKMQQIMA